MGAANKIPMRYCVAHQREFPGAQRLSQGLTIGHRSGPRYSELYGLRSRQRIPEPALNNREPEREYIEPP